MLEADPLRFAELQRRYLSNPNVYCINELVTFDGERSLDSLLMNTPLPKQFDLISIDVDGSVSQPASESVNNPWEKESESWWSLSRCLDDRSGMTTTSGRACSASSRRW